jgi:hypothetical protein
MSVIKKTSIIEVENKDILKNNQEPQTEDLDAFIQIKDLDAETDHQKAVNKKDFIYSIFPKRLFAELYFAWCKDCSEKITIDNAKYFRDEISMRNNRDNKNFFFNSMRVGKNFLLAFIGNVDTLKLNKLNLADNLINDVCMHNIKNIIFSKRIVYLNLSSNMISTEGLKIFQKEVIESTTLNYLNVIKFYIFFYYIK